ncbi:MAG: DoxX family protein, partial [Gemmatimonadetes bacterium]|nr:DoxX family protein [Gemmatimonadota bacterium]
VPSLWRTPFVISRARKRLPPVGVTQRQGAGAAVAVARPGDGEPSPGSPSRIGAAAVIETIAGPLIILGLFTRPVAFILAGEMAVAYFSVHMPRSLWPIMSGGERPAFYCWTFLFFAANGAGAFSLDGLLRARRRSRVGG